MKTTGILKQKNIKLFSIKCTVCNSKKIEIHFEDEHERDDTIINKCYIICNKCNSKELINSSLSFI